jgi:glucose/arabinose dehydrogenase
MRPTNRLLASGAFALGATLAGAAAAQQTGALYTVTGHSFRPERVDATPELQAALRVPEGFAVGAFAADLGNPRMLAVATDGTVYVTRPETNDVVALRDEDGDGQADGEPRVVATGLDMVHGIALRDGRIYLTTVNEIYEGRIEHDGAVSEIHAVIDDLPEGGQHPRRTIEFGPDGRLYLQIGSSCNSCLETDQSMAAISVIDPAGWSRRVFAHGLRNPLGFDWHPETEAMWAADHGSDWLGDEVPPDELNLLEDGAHYGWPFCWGERRPDWLSSAVPPDGTPKEKFCAERTEAPALGLEAHSAGIDLVFYDGEQFPDEYRGDAFIAQRGSWNRKDPVGYKVVRVNFENGQPVGVEDFLADFLTADRQSHFGRLAGLAIDHEGALLVSDDTNGIIYRVSHEGGPRQARASD